MDEARQRVFRAKRQDRARSEPDHGVAPKGEEAACREPTEWVPSGQSDEQIGPNGGDAGGKLLYQGSVEVLKKAKGSVTAECL
ncbi:MAG: hypothetical protein AAGH40_01835 [Verrucomicrobiota bacterium]